MDAPPSYQKGLCKLWEEFLTKGTITGPSLLSGHKKPLLSHKSGFPRDSVVKNPPANAGDLGSIPGSGRASSIPGGGNGNPLQYSRLGTSTDRGVHGVATSQTRLKCFHFTFTFQHLRGRWNYYIWFGKSLLPCVWGQSSKQISVTPRRSAGMGDRSPPQCQSR